METPVKNQLFKFITLRNPQLIAEQDKDPGFVFYPVGEANRFYDAVNGLPENQKAAALTTASSGFSAMATKTEVRARYTDLYDFSDWLMRNKNSLSFASIEANGQNIAALTTAEQVVVWENLIYQTIHRSSVYVREACIQLLVANKFITAFTTFLGTVTTGHVFTEDQDKEFTRRAHASVVISKTIFPDVTQSTSVTSTTSMKKLQGLADSFLAKQEIQQYKTLQTELKEVERAYTVEQKALYNSALKTHQQSVKDLIDAATPTIVEKTDAGGTVTSRVKSYPDVEIPSFSFQKTTPIDETYLTGKISASSLDIMKAKGWDQLNDFQQVYKAIGQAKKTNYKMLGAYNKLNRTKKVSLRGATLNVSQKSAQPYCFSAVDYKLTTGEQGFSMALAVDTAGLTVTSAAVNVDIAATSFTMNGRGFRNLVSNSDFISIFFEFDPILRETGSEIRLYGQFTLSNGATYEFDVSSIADEGGRFKFSGCTSLNNGPSSDSTNKVYGVSKLGIADFRRVDQELCCYVPGEVSHIENIMAREYKERETRSLNSVDVTTERTEEREVENLTDSTTTERNEMQSEVSTVLTEDESQNFGASANVNGSFGKKFNYSADAFANFSSASSVSNSNSQAQTYAQEVTERAMERIVQKVSSKRTTRILKEFEEKNIHGFDNTKGDVNISGVYRWVDKIYKNSIVNYGKRLMYEFAIPEPSKFFKEAIYKQLENDENVSGVIMPEAPVHPTVLFDIDGVTDISESNYQEIAGHYGAEVSPKPMDTVHLNASFEFAGFVDDGHEVDFENKTLDIPEGYYTTAATVQASGMHDGDTVSGQGISVTVGNLVFHDVVELYYDARELSAQDGGILQNFTNEISLSFFAVNYIGANAAVEVTCTLSEEANQQWQNETYNAIMEAYERRVQEYNESVQANEVIQEVESERVRFNPLQNRSLEKREIKRIAIELLTEQKGLSVAKNNYTNVNDATGVAKVMKNPGLEAHASAVKFFEQAFDWDIMAYIFYPYFYANEQDWTALFQESDAADPLFQAFLQSGMARAVVPVRPGFEEAVNWYMETGEIWNGQGLVVDQDDDLYLSVSEEMQTIEGTVEGTWESRIPTSLTLLQKDSAALKGEGLPCYCPENQEGNAIENNTNLIGGADGPTVGGIGKFVVS
ncbi:MAG: hypothetical protein AAF617_06335 [Bacteroidota bacterium]